MISSFLVAHVFAHRFRFPVPLGGMLGPSGDVYSYDTGALLMISFAWLFYGIFGGFVVVPLLGAGVGVAAGKVYSSSGAKEKMIALWAFIAGVVPVFF